MIYLDNSATSFPKPIGMRMAMDECIRKYCGNPGRSGHYMSIKTGEEVYNARKTVSKLFNIDNPERLIFTKNTTEALNMGICGLLKEGDHVITTSMEHNSVLRPLKRLERQKISHTILRADNRGIVEAETIENAIKPNTALIVVTAASNVTGTKLPLKEIGRIAKRREICFMVDGAQGAGCMNLDVQSLGIHMLAVPGHKGLLGPLGTGALYVSEGLPIEPLIAGGTGTASKDRNQPCDFPEGYEAGTINAPAVIGLGYSAEYVSKIGTDVIGLYEEELIGWAEERLQNMDFVELYGPSPKEKTGICLINVEGLGSEEVTEILNREFGIAVRGGFHCAGLAHKSIGTWKRGAVRISVGPFNTQKDMETLVDAIWTIGKFYRNINNM